MQLEGHVCKQMTAIHLNKNNNKNKLNFSHCDRVRYSNPVPIRKQPEPQSYQYKTTTGQKQWGTLEMKAGEPNILPQQQDVFTYCDIQQVSVTYMESRNRKEDN